MQGRIRGTASEVYFAEGQDDARIKHRRTQVEELYLKSWTQAALAGELGVCQATISSDLKAIRQKWSESRIRNLDEVREEELKKSDDLLQKAWNGWHRSQEPAEMTRIFQKDDEQILEKIVRQQSGDPRFLQMVHRAIEARCNLQGLDAAGESNVYEQSILAEAIPQCLDFYHHVVLGEGPEPIVIDDEYLIRHTEAGSTKLEI